MTNRRNSTSNDDLLELKYTPKQAINVITPVCICLLLTIISSALTKKLFSNTEREYSLNNQGLKETIQFEVKDRLTSLSEILVMCAVYAGNLIVMTLVMLFIIYMNWYKVLICLLSVTLGASFVFVSFLFWTTILASFELTIDSFSSLLFILNNAILGFLSIMWKSPIILNKTYQIQLAVLIGWFLDNLTPIWLGWILLIVLSIWDLVAVLPSFGPLKLIIEILDKRGQKIPDSLIYSAYFKWPALTKLVEYLKTNENENLDQNINNNNNRADEEKKILKENNPIIDIIEPLNQPNVFESNEDDGPKLGLGDFVFYSFLIAKSVSQFNWSTVIACYLSIIIGLIITMTLTAITRKPLPALPISIFLAILVFFVNEFTVIPFLNRLNLNQIFI